MNRYRIRECPDNSSCLGVTEWGSAMFDGNTLDATTVHNLVAALEAAPKTTVNGLNGVYMFKMGGAVDKVVA